MAADGKDVTKRQKSYFQSLDRQHRGYLDNDDISADPFLTENFANCDADHDGKLTWQEFKTCTHNNPPPPGK
jgi:Ca2+-binding EF-hand superfamily protein